MPVERLDITLHFDEQTLERLDRIISLQAAILFDRGGQRDLADVLNKSAAALQAATAGVSTKPEGG